MIIKIYGQGCSGCKKTKNIMRDIAHTLGCKANIQNDLH